MPEGGHLTCGDLVVGTDTHSTTYGAFNAFGTGVEGTDCLGGHDDGQALVPRARVDPRRARGRLQPGVWAKDVTLSMLGRFGAEGANYKALEYCGEAVAAMDIDDRMTLANHAAELGAKAALLEADEKTFAWLRAHGARRAETGSCGRGCARMRNASRSMLRRLHRRSRAGIKSTTWSPVPDVAGQRIDIALIGTCTNGADRASISGALGGCHIFCCIAKTGVSAKVLKRP